jgi:hypothetical protein
MGWHCQFGRILLIACFPSLTPVVTVCNLLISLIDIRCYKLHSIAFAIKRLLAIVNGIVITCVLMLKYAAHTVYLSVLCEPQTKHGLFPYVRGINFWFL